jgi:hypothetical protein
LRFGVKAVIDGAVLFATLAAVVIAAPPAQGMTLKVPKPATFGVTSAEADAVQAAVKLELEAEGYAVVTGDDAKGFSAIISGSVTRVGAGYVVNLAIIRQTDHKVLENVREEAKSTADLPKASIAIAKQLTSSLRLAAGVRAKALLNPKVPERGTVPRASSP